MKALLLVSALMAGAVSAATGCPLTAADGQRLDGDGLQIAWAVAAVEPRSIAVGEPFTLDVRACPADSKLLSVKATMPSHRHGMNYVPSIKAIGPGQWRVEGLLWHMRGGWELVFELRRGGSEIQSLRQMVELQ